MEKIENLIKELFILIFKNSFSFKDQVKLIKQKQKLLDTIKNIENEYDLLINKLENTNEK